MSITVTMTNKQARLVLDALISSRTRKRRASISAMDQETAHNLYQVEQLIYEAFRPRDPSTVFTIAKEG